MFARVTIHRVGARDQVEAVTYVTINGTAKAGVHYAARSGTVTFDIGEYATSVDIPLIDNGLVDGAKDFQVLLITPEQGVVTGPWIRIEDNEFGSAVDPLFVPDLPWLYFYSPLPTPDGGLLLSRDGAGATLTILRSNGWVDVDFSAKVRRSFTNSALYGLQVLNDGRVFADVSEYNTPGWRLVRLLRDGALETVFGITNFSHQLVSQADGKVLVSAGGNGSYTLHRFNTDGSPDAGFSIPSCTSPTFALQDDQKIVVVQSNSLVRLNPDGQVDSTFSTPALTNGIWWYFVLRHNGKFLVVEGASVIQLNPDGSVDANFNLHDLPLLNSLETPDGSLFAANSQRNGLGAVTRWNPSGTSTSTLAVFNVPVCDDYQRTLAWGGSGRIFMFGSFTDVDGFPRRGLARLFTNPPERDFRVLTPAEFYRLSGVARVRVVRTGATTNAASVSFTTRDDTARAGEDYAPQSGTLNFVPLEVSKEVLVPLLAKAGVDARLCFKLELNNPSAGYTNIASTPIAILPDLRIATDSLRPRADGSMTITLHGTMPGRYYGLESSTDLKNWVGIAGTQASGSTVVFDNLPRASSPQFYRARTD
jgi:hypothetical protein